MSTHAKFTIVLILYGIIYISYVLDTLLRPHKYTHKKAESDLICYLGGLAFFTFLLLIPMINN